MKYLERIAAAALSVFSSLGLHAQSPEAIAAFSDLMEARHFIRNYQQVAAVSAKVYGDRGQGSDREFAAFSAKAAAADLTDYRNCMSRAFASGPLSEADAKELVRI